MLSETTPQGLVTYTYDADGRRQSMTVFGQTQVNYSFNNASRLTAIAQGAATVSLGYDSNGRRTSLTLPNGVTTTYNYDAASQLTGINYLGGALAPANLTYSYDLAGRRVGVGGSLASTQLPAAVSSAVYNANNQLIQWGGTAMTYDANGNTLSDGMNSYVWDARNRLASADNNAASFAYDPLGRRVSKTVLSTTTNFLYDGANAVQEFGTLPTANLITGGVDERFTRTDASGTYDYLTDALGSTVTLTDAAGNSVAQYSYAPFGSLSASGATTSNSYTYTGRESDGLGIDYYRARYYNPTTGRFLSEDPMGFAGSGPNLYEYAGDSPTNLVDPSGEVALYGNYCGPDWTGARREQYDPSHDLPITIVVSFNSLGYPQGGVSQTPYYAPPVDNLDAACENHDKCYAQCRANNKCDKTGMKNCMTQCNRVLGQEAANSGVSGPSEWAIEKYMNNFPGQDEPNDPSCKCKR